MQLLFLGSLIGDSAKNKLHPQIINDLARNLVRQILLNSPAGVTPGNLVEVRSFNCYTCNLEPIDLTDATERPQHFLRPSNTAFAESGHLSSCRNFQNFAAEDVLHIGPLCEYARRIGCKVYEVPAEVEVTHYMAMDRIYCIYNHMTACTGVIYFQGHRVLIEYQEHQDGHGLTCKELELLTWQSELSATGFIPIPMIWRPGACIKRSDDETKVACIVPPPDDVDKDGNFCLEERNYLAMIRLDETIPVPAMKVMENLLPIGTEMFLKMESQSAARLVQRLSVAISNEQRRNCLIKVYLGSPDILKPAKGKLYVVCLVQKMFEMSDETLAVNPWDLTLDKGQNRVFNCIKE